jgi:hypothetical protein
VAESIPAENEGVTQAAFDAAHKALTADTSIQFELTDAPLPKPPIPPGWLRDFVDFLITIAPAVRVLFWVGLAGLALTIVYFILREFTDFRFPWQRARSAVPEEDWTPELEPARALLAEADALAARGNFAEAAHLLLLRSVEDIERKKPDLLKPSSTAREISIQRGLSEKTRETFSLIARHVEASLFGGRSLDASGWAQCREAYSRFALVGDWA